MATKVYQERQRFHDWFMIGLFALAIVSLLFGAASYLWNPESTLAYSVVSLLLALGLAYVIYWFVNLRSKLTITAKKIKFKLKGSIRATQKIAWKDVASCTIIKTPYPLKWNRPKATLSDEKFYSLSGRNGLVITTVEGNRFFIGVENVGELRDALSGETQLWEVVDDRS